MHSNYEDSGDSGDSGVSLKVIVESRMTLKALFEPLPEGYIGFVMSGFCQVPCPLKSE